MPPTKGWNFLHPENALQACLQACLVGALCICHSYCFFFLIFLCESVLPACKCVYHIGAVPTEARRSPKLELQRVVSYHVGAGH